MAAPQEAQKLKLAGGVEHEDTVQLEVFQELYAELKAYHGILINGSDSILLFQPMMSDETQNKLSIRGMDALPVIVIAPPNHIREMGRVSMYVTGMLGDNDNFTVMLHADNEAYDWEGKVSHSVLDESSLGIDIPTVNYTTRQGLGDGHDSAKTGVLALAWNYFSEKGGFVPVTVKLPKNFEDAFGELDAVEQVAEKPVEHVAVVTKPETPEDEYERLLKLASEKPGTFFRTVQEKASRFPEGVALVAGKRGREANIGKYDLIVRMVGCEQSSNTVLLQISPLKGFGWVSLDALVPADRHEEHPMRMMITIGYEDEETVTIHGSGEQYDGKYRPIDQDHVRPVVLSHVVALIASLQHGLLVSDKPKQTVPSRPYASAPEKPKYDKKEPYSMKFKRRYPRR